MKYDLCYNYGDEKIYVILLIIVVCSYFNISFINATDYKKIIIVD